MFDAAKRHARRETNHLSMSSTGNFEPNVEMNSLYIKWSVECKRTNNCVTSA